MSYARRRAGGGCCDNCTCGVGGVCPDCVGRTRFRAQLRPLGSVTSQPIPRVALGSVTSQPLVRGVLAGSSLGDTDPATLDAINQRADQIVALIDEQNKSRKLALIIAGASALFAAVKLGLVAFPHIKARVA